MCHVFDLTSRIAGPSWERVLEIVACMHNNNNSHGVHVFQIAVCNLWSDPELKPHFMAWCNNPDNNVADHPCQAAAAIPRRHASEKTEHLKVNNNNNTAHNDKKNALASALSDQLYHLHAIHRHARARWKVQTCAVLQPQQLSLHQRLSEQLTLAVHVLQQNCVCGHAGPEQFICSHDPKV